MKNDSNNRVPANKHYLSRRVGWIVFIFMLGIGGYLALPSNYYLRRALIHLLPKIDQYPIFENRVVKAGSPRPWELSEAYNTKSIPERYLPRFEELGTVAYVIIQDNRLLFEQYWEDYSPESHSNSFSMAKSIVSLAIGCAIDDGFIRDVDQPVSDFFPEFKGYDGKALTLRHLLTMSAGVDFDEGALRKKIQFMFPGVCRTIRFEFSGPSLQAVLDRLPTAVVLDISGGRALIEAEVYGAGIMMYLLSQGSWVKVIAPDDFVSEYRAELRKMAEQYK